MYGYDLGIVYTWVTKMD